MRWRIAILVLGIGALVSACGGVGATSSGSSGGLTARHVAPVVRSGVEDSLSSVSCASASLCMAVGSAGLGTQYFAGSMSGLAQVAGPSLSSASFASASVVDCMQSNTCVVAGNNGADLFQASFANGAWSRPLLLAPARAAALGFTVNGGYCFSSGDCLYATSVTFDRTGQSGGMIVQVQATKGIARPIFTLRPRSPFVYATLTDIACIAAMECYASGYEATRSGHDTPVLLASSKGLSAWSPVIDIGWPGGSVRVYGLSCDSAGVCGLAGESFTTSGNDGVEAVLLSGAWHTSTVFAPDGSGDLGFYGVQCSLSTCFFVGGTSIIDVAYQVVAPSDLPTQVVTPFPVAGATIDSAALYSVWCDASARTCMAVGSTDLVRSSTEVNLAVTAIGGTWSEANPTSPTGGTLVWNPGAVSCESGIEHCAVLLSGASESAVVTGGPRGELRQVMSGQGLQALACAEGGSCYVVGGVQFKPLVDSFQIGGTSGSAAQLPVGFSGRQATLSRVVCSGSGSCLAVGDQYHQYPAQDGLTDNLPGPLAVAWHGRSGTPSLVKVASPSTAQDAQAGLNYVACAPGGVCDAVGSYSVFGNPRSQTFLEVFKNGAGALGPAVPAVQGTVSQYPLGFGCSQQGCLLAEEATTQQDTGSLALFELRGGAWTRVPLPASLAGESRYLSVSGVACSEASCLAVGSITDPLGIIRALILKVEGVAARQLASPHVAASTVPTSAGAVYCSPQQCVVAGGAYPVNALDYPWLAQYS